MSRITMCVYCWQCQLDAKLKVLCCPRMEHQSFSATLIDDTMINKSWNGKSRKKSFSETQWWMAWWSIREWLWMKHQHRSEVISINLFCLQTLKITFLLCNDYIFYGSDCFLKYKTICSPFKSSDIKTILYIFGLRGLCENFENIFSSFLLNCL